MKSRLWDLERDGVTQGLISRFLACPEKLRVSHILGLRREQTSDALRFGSIFHDMLRFHKATEQSPNQTMDFIYERDYKLAKNKLEVEGNQLWYAIALEVLKVYVNYWKDDDENRDWLGVEKVFDVRYTPSELPVPTTRLRGRRDGEYRSTSIFLKETKTRAQHNEEAAMDKIAIDFQVWFYLLSLYLEYGEFPGGVLYDIVRRPLLRQGKKESEREFLNRVRQDVITRPDHYFVRYPCSVEEDEFMTFKADLDSILYRIWDWWNDGVGTHYKNTSNCQLGYLTCEFLPYCARKERSLYTTRELFNELDD